MTNKLEGAKEQGNVSKDTLNVEKSCETCATFGNCTNETACKESDYFEWSAKAHATAIEKSITS